jgi:tripartite-type tricarboxylate transporter receptor subunit TctC
MYRRVIATCLTTMALLVTVTMAAEYPTKPIRFVVPAAPGSASDRYARLIAQRLSEVLKQPVVVDNKPGAAGNIGARYRREIAPRRLHIAIGN